jgi:hypothetical protein
MKIILESRFRFKATREAALSWHSEEPRAAKNPRMTDAPLSPNVMLEIGSRRL